jgi:DNA-binding transcriptional ArsR family regulator
MDMRADDIEVLKARAVDAAGLLKLLSNEARLMILCQLSDGEASVGQLAEGAGMRPAAISQHLAKLRAEKVVSTRRDAQTIYYSLIDPAAQAMIATLCKVYK